MIVRIELKKIGLSNVLNQHKPSTDLPFQPANPVIPANPDDNVELLPSPAISFALRTDIPEEWQSARYSHPVAGFSFLFTDDDYPLVRYWLEGGTPVNRLPSASLVSNLSSALSDALGRLDNSSLRSNLHISPFKAAWCLRTRSGRRLAMSKPVTLFPSARAPRTVVRSHSLFDNGATVTSEFFCNPSRLAISCPQIESPEKYSSIAAVDILATPHAETFDQKVKSSGIANVYISSSEEDLAEGQSGEKVRVVNYDRYSAAEVAAIAESLSDFRVVASIPFEQMAKGFAWQDVAFAGAPWLNWKNLPKPGDKEKTGQDATDDDNSGSDGGEESGGSTGGNGQESQQTSSVWVDTEPLSLGMPEKVKYVHGVTLRGIFPRKNAMIELYGSHHRENWRLLAKASGAHISGLRGIGYRWYKVRIRTELRKGDFLEALTFTIN